MVNIDWQKKIEKQPSLDEPFSLAIVLAYFIRGKECIIGIRSREECCSFSFENEIYRSGTIYLLE